MARRRLPDKAIVKFRHSHLQRDWSMGDEPRKGGYRHTQNTLKVSPNTISRAHKNVAKKQKGKKPRGWNLKGGRYGGDLGRIKGSHSKKS